MNKYQWDGINIPSEKDDWKKFEKNNVTINVLCTKNEKVYPAYISKNNSNCDKQVILLMIINRTPCKAMSEGRRWHYFTVKKVSALLRGKTSKCYSDFFLSQLPSVFCNRKKT